MAFLTPRALWRRIRAQWNRSDTIVFATNLCALGALIWNCWRNSVAIAYAATAAPLAFQAVRVLGLRPGRHDPLRRALVFGFFAAAVWPALEWSGARIVGWWGGYSVKGIMMLDTPLYTLLISWQANTYLCYIERRVRDLGYGAWGSGAWAALSAFAMGVLGESLYVWAGMWWYHRSAFDCLAVPFFIPAGYTLAAATLPMLAGLRVWKAAAIYEALTIAGAVAVGVAMGFYPR